MEIVFRGTASRWDRWRALLGGHFGLEDPLSPVDEQTELRTFFSRISPTEFEKIFDTPEKREKFLTRVDEGESVEDLVSAEVQKSQAFAKIMTAVSHATQSVLLSDSPSSADAA